MAERLIHIDWEGPHSLRKIEILHGQTDYGLYQVYVHHPIILAERLRVLAHLSAPTVTIRF